MLVTPIFTPNLHILLASTFSFFHHLIFWQSKLCHLSDHHSLFDFLYFQLGLLFLLFNLSGLFPSTLFPYMFDALHILNIGFTFLNFSSLLFRFSSGSYLEGFNICTPKVFLFIIVFGFSRPTNISIILQWLLLAPTKLLLPLRPREITKLSFPTSPIFILLFLFPFLHSFSLFSLPFSLSSFILSFFSFSFSFFPLFSLYTHTLLSIFFTSIVKIESWFRCVIFHIGITVPFFGFIA